MKRDLMFAFVAVGTFMASGPLAADPVRLAQNAPLLPAYEVRAIVSSAGLDPIGPATRRGWSYVVRAVDDEDREVRVIVDARRGEIIAIRPVMARRLVPLGPRIVTGPPSDYDGRLGVFGAPDIYGNPPRPPRTVNRLSAPPRHPPMPRPRPSEASLASTNAIKPPAEQAPVATAKPQKTEPSKKEVEVPAVTPLDPGAHAPIAN